MARPNEKDGHGWDFVKAGKTYQYKEEAFPLTSFIGTVTILEDNSNDEDYNFKVRVEESNMEPPTEDGIFDTSHVKKLDGIYSGMPQFYEYPEYSYETTWRREK